MKTIKQKAKVGEKILITDSQKGWNQHDGSFKVKLTNQMNKDMWILNQSKASAREVIGNIFENEDLVNAWQFYKISLLL